MCTANLQATDSIGDESRALRSILLDVEADIKVGSLTADGDSHIQQALGADIPVYRDMRHFGQILKRQIEKAPFSDNVFPGATKAARSNIHKRFAIDVAKRCNAEYHQCYTKKKGDLDSIKRQLTYAIDAIIKCYEGDCTLRKKYSFVCRGKSAKFLLPLNTKLNFSYNTDEKLFRDCLHFRLGRKAVELTQLNSNTQKSESINKTYQKTNPKLITWSRNFSPRIHSAILLRNNSFAKSTADKMLAAGLRPSTPIKRHLQKEDQRITYRTKHNKSLKPCTMYRKKQVLYRTYDLKRSEPQPQYKKEVAMPSLNFTAIQAEHCYSKRK